MNQHLSGLPAWLVQRLSALYMLAYSLLAAGCWWLAAPFDYETWRASVAHPVVAIATAIFFLALLLHAWVGMRDVILDYAGRFPWMRLALLALLGGWLIAMGVWVIRILGSGIVL